MSRDRAAYMREYRAAKKAAHERYDEAKPLIGHLKTLAHEQAERIAELGAEVARLKRELAARPPLEEVRLALKGARGLALDSNEPALDAELGRAIDKLDRYSTRPFTPVPKTRK